MICDSCGRSITRAYHLNGAVLGSGCYRKANPYHSNPAEAVFNAAAAILSGERAPSVLPGGWVRLLSNRHLQDEAETRAALHDGCNAYWLALLARNDMARTGRQVFPIRDLDGFS